MSRRVDTANRTVLTLLGLPLFGGGGVGLAAGFGAFGEPPPVLPEPARRFEDAQPWFCWAGRGGVQEAPRSGPRNGALVEDRARELTVAVELADYTDVAEVRRVLEDRVVAHARQAVDDPELPVDIELRPGRRSGGRGLS